MSPSNVAWRSAPGDGRDVLASAARSLSAPRSDADIKKYGARCDALFTRSTAACTQSSWYPRVLHLPLPNKDYAQAPKTLRMALLCARSTTRLAAAALPGRGPPLAVVIRAWSAEALTHADEVSAAATPDVSRASARSGRESQAVAAYLASRPVTGATRWYRCDGNRTRVPPQGWTTVSGGDAPPVCPPLPLPPSMPPGSYASGWTWSSPPSPSSHPA